MCNVSTTGEVTAGALPASVLELLDAVHRFARVR
jgi:hypothetical protein